VRLSRSLRATIRACRWTTTLDRNFAGVLRGCAEGRESAWITPALAAGYLALNGLGLARSIEVWDREELVGGMYGVLVGGVFTGESMFRRRSDASKIALADMALRLHQAGAILLDTQFVTAHLRAMGAVEMSRDRFLGILAGARDATISLDTDRRPVSRLVE
jgi:leucyl/phenylalanyl-tRNA--protein transferase